MKQDGLLLQAILARPSDGGPRLHYAKWLESNGDAPRAEFIRTQIALAKTPKKSPDYRRLRDRQSDLLYEYGRNWLEELPRWAWNGAEFDRGFVVKISGTAKQFLADAAQLRATIPLERLHVERVGKHARALFSSPHLSGLSELYVKALDPAGAMELAGSPHIASLRSLDVRNGCVEASGAQAIAAAPQLSRLTSLAIGAGLYDGSEIGDVGAKAVAGSPYFRRLVSLDLMSNDIGPTGAKALAASPNLAKVKILDLQNNRLGDAGLVKLLASPHLTRAQNVNLRYNTISAVGVRALAAWPHLKKMRELRLLGNKIADAGAIALAKSEFTTGLVELELEPKGITEAGIAALKKSVRLKKLRSLVIGYDLMISSYASVSD
jgi:uncharacterized protein (TIGR02996 family)